MKFRIPIETYTINGTFIEILELLPANQAMVQVTTKSAVYSTLCDLSDMILTEEQRKEFIYKENEKYI